MKTVSSRALVIGITSFVLVSLTISPVSAVTKTDSDITPERCSHVISLRSKGRDNLAANLLKMNTGSSNRIKKIANDKTNIDKKVKASRSNAKTRFEEKLKKLEEKAGWTKAQKQALATYKTNMLLARKNREFSVDGARTQYRSALGTALTNQQKNIAAATTTYQKAVENAFATVVNSCDKETDMPALKASVKTARETLKNALSKIKVTTTAKIKQLATTRNDAIKKADDTFKQQATDFTKILIAALGVKD